MREGFNVGLIYLLNFAMDPRNGGAAVDDFAVGLLRATGYVRATRVALTQKALPLHNCGKTESANANVCVVDLSQDDVLLV